MGQRVDGYYWVKYNDKWEIARWQTNPRLPIWVLLTTLSIDGIYKRDSDFTEINETPILPPEK